MKSYILLENIEIYATHGVFLQEKEVGNTFIVNLRVTLNLGKASYTDQLNDTVNYGQVYDIVAQEMAIPSNLLEHVAGRIMRRLKNELYQIEGIMIKISKKNPPIGGQVESASVLFVD